VTALEQAIKRIKAARTYVARSISLRGEHTFGGEEELVTLNTSDVRHLLEAVEAKK